MTYEEVKQLIHSKKPGTMFHVQYKKNIPIAAKHKGTGVEVIRVTDVQVRAGISYSNMRSTIEKRGEGAGVNKLAFGSWVKGEEKYFLENTNKDGTHHIYVRLYPNPSKVSNVKYFIKMPGTGEFAQVSAEFLSINGYVTPGNLKSEQHDVFNPEVDNIIRIW